jgi:ribonuclease Z
MAKITILGSAFSIPDENHENTHMVVAGNVQTVMVDCVGSPIPRLHRAAIEFNQVTDLILTHFHPDHVSGVPTLLMDMWLLGRHNPLHIYGLDHTLDRIKKMMGFYDWESWPNFFPVLFHHLPGNEMTKVLDSEEMTIYSSPVKHWIPTIGLRFEFKDPKWVVTYSCDTEPCPQMVRLAQNSDVLIHEATGLSQGHSSAKQAANIGMQAGAKSLYLIHYPTGEFDAEPLIKEAREVFTGPVTLAKDFMVLEV